MRSVDVTELKPIQVPIGISMPLGNFSSGGSTKLIPFSLPAKGDRASFNIFFAARNGSWVETLRLVKGNWKKAIRVFRYLSKWREQQFDFDTVKRRIVKIKREGATTVRAWIGTLAGRGTVLSAHRKKKPVLQRKSLKVCAQ
jgi:hypothetical protein